MATAAPRPSMLRVARGALVVAALAIALSPQPALARCDDYLLAFCRGVGFCVRTSTTADSGAIDNPADVLAEGSEPVLVSQTASDATSASAEATGDAAASVGILSLFAAADVVGTSQSGGSSAVTFPFALLRIDDLVFSGPAPSVETSLLLELEGVLTASAANVGDDGLVQSNVQLQLNGNVCDADGAALLGFFGARGLLVRKNGAAALETFPTNTGILDGVPIDGTPFVVETEPFSVPTGAPLQMELWITMSGGALVAKSVGGSDTPSGSALATGDYSNSVRLPAPGPVFSLPAGFTVDSAQAAIVNNRLPEPSDTLACAVALAVLLVLRRSARRAHCVAAPLLVALIAPSAARAATVSVPADFATVQAAVAAVESDADPGEVILASDGPFDENVDVSESVTIRAATGFAPVIEPTSGSAPPIEIRASAGASTSVVLRGLVLRAGSASGGPGSAISVRNDSATEALDVRVDQSDVTVAIGDHGLRAGSGSGGPVSVTVTQSRFEVEGDGSGQPACIFLDPPSFPLFLVAVRNEFRFSRAAGIVLDPFIDAPVSAAIERNRFEGFPSPSGSGRMGVDLGGSNTAGNIQGDAAVIDNLFVRTSSALELNGQAENDLYAFFANNTVVDSSYAGISAQTFGTSSAELHLFNNVVVGTASPSRGDFGGAGISAYASMGTTLVVNAGYNLLFDNEVDYDGVLAPPTDVLADPLFVDAAADDYRLAPGSPAIDAGLNAPPGGLLPPVDFDGAPRIRDGNGDTAAVIDIGAFEAPEPVASAAGVAVLTALGALRRAARA